MSDLRTASPEVQADLANKCQAMAVQAEARDWGAFLKNLFEIFKLVFPLILPLFLEPGPTPPTPPSPVG